MDDFHKGGDNYWWVLQQLENSLRGTLTRYPEVSKEDKNRILSAIRL